MGLYDTESVPQSQPHTPAYADVYAAALDTQATGNIRNSQEYIPTERVRICMYCSTVLDASPEYCLIVEPANASHGACDRCFRRFSREMAAGIRSPLLDLIRVRRVHIWGVPYDPYDRYDPHHSDYAAAIGTPGSASEHSHDNR